MREIFGYWQDDPMHAPPAACDMPTEPGWYWAKIFSDRWRAVLVYRDSRGVLKCERGHGERSGAWCEVSVSIGHKYWTWGQPLLAHEPRPRPRLSYYGGT